MHELVHELGTHQIELEMQVEELRRAQTELEVSRSRYADLYDFAPIGYLTFEKSGLIREANLTAAKLLGVDRRFLVNAPFLIYLDKDDRSAFHSHCLTVLKSGTRQILEVRLKDRNKTELYAQLDSIAVEDLEGNAVAIRTAVNDITDRKKVEAALRKANETLELRVAERTAALRENERKYTLLFDKAAIAASLTKVPEDVFVEVNEEFEKLFGFTRQEVLGRTSLELGISNLEEHNVIISEIEQKGVHHNAEKHVVTKSGRSASS